MNKLYSLGAALAIAFCCSPSLRAEETVALSPQAEDIQMLSVEEFLLALSEQPSQESNLVLLPSGTPFQVAQATTTQRTSSADDPDVLLDVPNLSVEEITLNVENLNARVSLNARLANLLQLTAGADVEIDSVELTIRGVQASVLLKVRLDNVARIIDRTLTTIDNNPEILVRLLESVDSTVGTVGDTAQSALQPGGVVDNAVGSVGQTLGNVTQQGGLLSETVNNLGQTVRRTVDQSGNILEQTTNRGGQTLGRRNLGNILDLPVLSETTNQQGQTLRRVRDESGSILELTLDSAGELLNSRVVQRAREGGQ